MKNQMQLVCNNRLKSVLVQDKQSNPVKIVNILKSEVLYALKNYMEITASDLFLNITVDEYGYYVLDIGARVRRLKTVGSFNEKYED